jgi:hypothetical protein
MCVEHIECDEFDIQGDTKKWELLKNSTKIEEIQTCKTFLWRQHPVDRSIDPWLLNGEVCSSRSLFHSAANCTWLPLRISKDGKKHNELEC